MCTLGNVDCLAKCHSYYNSWVSENKTLANILLVVFVVAVVSTSYKICLTCVFFILIVVSIRIPSNFKAIILQTVVKYGNESDWFHLFNTAKMTLVLKDRMLILRALTQTRDYNLLKLYVYMVQYQICLTFFSINNRFPILQVCCNHPWTRT